MKLHRSAVGAVARSEGHALLLSYHHQGVRGVQAKVQLGGGGHNLFHVRKRSGGLQLGLYLRIADVGNEKERVVVARIAVHRKLIAGTTGILAVGHHRAVGPEHHHPQILNLALLFRSQSPGGRTAAHGRHNQVERYLRRLAFCHRARTRELLADASRQKQGGEEQRMEEKHRISYLSHFISLFFLVYLIVLFYCSVLSFLFCLVLRLGVRTLSISPLCPSR